MTTTPAGVIETEHSVHNEYKENKIVLASEKTRDSIYDIYLLSLCESDY
jgi:hypothetical protein